MSMLTELTQKIKNAIQDNRLVGNTSFSYDEYEALLEYTCRLSTIVPICSKNESKIKIAKIIEEIDETGETVKVYETIFVTLVEIAKRWKSDDDNNDTSFWKFAFKTIGIEYNQKLYKDYLDVINDLGRTNKILIADTGKEYWATLMMHAFAPIKSIYAFLDLGYNIYKKDLDFNYTESDRSVCGIATVRFCEILQSAVGNNKTVSIGTNTYGVKIGLRTLALNDATQNDFVALLDKTLEIINKLFHRQEFKPEGYFEKLICDWWQNKLAEAGRDRKTVHKSAPAVSKQNITVKFVRDDDTVNIVIPPIRLDGGTASTIWLSVYVGYNDEQRVSEELFTKIGELTVTTKQKVIDLNKLFQGDEPIKFHVKITENGTVIFSKIIEKEFLLFSGENEVLSQISKANNYFVYARDINVIKTPDEISEYASNLYNIYPKAGEILSGTTQQVFFLDKASVVGNKDAVCLLGNLSDCEWQRGDISCAVFCGQVKLLIPDEISVNGLELVVGTKRFLLSELAIRREGHQFFDITDYIPKLKPSDVSVYSHLKEKQLLCENIVVFPNLSIVFGKEAFYGSDEKKLTISVDDERKNLRWDNIQNEVIYPLNDGNLIIRIPYTRWRIDDNEWRNQPFNKKYMWYKKHFHNGSLLEIDSAIDMENATMFAYIDGQIEVVERNETSGNYAIGKYIYSRENKRKIVFFVLPPSKENIELKERIKEGIGLFTVATEEHFVSEPLVYSDGKLLWQPEDSFVGDETRQFQADFYRKENEQFSVSGLKFSDDEIEGINEGIYKVKISSREKGLFKNEAKLFYEGEIIVGRKEKFHFENKRLKIISASGELRVGENAQMYWKPFKFDYYIDKIEFVERDGYEYYIGRLFVFDNSRKIYLDKMKNLSNEDEHINPVRIDIVTDNTFELTAGYNNEDESDFLGPLIYDIKQQSICNRNVSKSERYLYCCLNYYKFEVVNV